MLQTGICGNTLIYYSNHKHTFVKQIVVPFLALCYCSNYFPIAAKSSLARSKEIAYFNIET